MRNRIFRGTPVRRRIVSVELTTVQAIDEGWVIGAPTLTETAQSLFGYYSCSTYCPGASLSTR